MRQWSATVWLYMRPDSRLQSSSKDFGCLARKDWVRINLRFPVPPACELQARSRWTLEVLAFSPVLQVTVPPRALSGYWSPFVFSYRQYIRIGGLCQIRLKPKRETRLTTG